MILALNLNQINSSTFPNTNGTITIPPSEDRYAALKDLDSMMKQANLKDDTNVTWNFKETNSGKF